MLSLFHDPSTIFRQENQNENAQKVYFSAGLVQRSIIISGLSIGDISVVIVSFC